MSPQRCEVLGSRPGHLRSSDSEALWEFFGGRLHCCAQMRSPHSSLGLTVFCQLFTMRHCRPWLVRVSFFLLSRARHIVCLSPQLAGNRPSSVGSVFTPVVPVMAPPRPPTPCRLTPTPSRPDRKSTTYLKLFAGAHSNKHYRSLCVVAGHLWIFDSSES